MDNPRAPEEILREIARIETIERGKLCEIRRPSGKIYHNLQFWSEGKNRCEYIRARDLDAVRDAVEGHERFQALVDEYVSAVESLTRGRRRGTDLPDGGKKGLCARRQRPPPSRN